MKHEIEIPDLPEGWEACYYIVPEDIEYYSGKDGNLYATARIKLTKKQPRRIVLEETCETTHSFWNNSIHFDDIIINIDSQKQWKIVKDNNKCAE